MQPTSFSASALHVAELCLSRYNAESIEHSRSYGQKAADLGTTCHGALEDYVQSVYINKTHKPELKLLLDLFGMHFTNNFGFAEMGSEQYEDGKEMLKRWHARQDFAGVEVLSCEIKESFPVKTSIGEIPFNYIWDRHDRLGPNEYRVNDYKTNRFYLQPGDLKKKLQARFYSLAAQIKYKDAERIWIQFDMLRHDAVGTVFTRDDNIATWKFLLEKAEEIIQTNADTAPETLNNECRFCVKKISCDAVRRNYSTGGVFSITDIKDAVDKRATLEWQASALSAVITELDGIIMAEAKEQDVLGFEGSLANIEIGVSQRRAVDAERVKQLIGPELFLRYGKETLTLADFDKMQKSPDIDPNLKAQLKRLVYTSYGEPKIKIKTKNPIDED